MKNKFINHIIFIFCFLLSSYSLAMNNAMPNNLIELTTLLNNLNLSLARNFSLGFDTYALLKELVPSKADKWLQEDKIIRNTLITFSTKTVKNPQSIIDDILTNLKNQNILIPTSIKVDYATEKIVSKENIVFLHVLYFLDQNKQPLPKINALTFLTKFLASLQQQVTIIQQKSSSASSLSNLLDLAVLRNPTQDDIKTLNDAIAKNHTKAFTLLPNVQIAD